MARLSAISTALPEHRLTQEQLVALITSHRSNDAARKIAAICANSGIDQRYLAMPPEAYLEPRSWATRSGIFAQTATDLAETAAKDVIAKAQLKIADIGTIMVISTTGIMTPSLPNELLHRMGFDAGTRTVPIFGYGCAGGVLGLDMANMLADADPSQPVLLIAVELCSLAYDFASMEKKDIIASALFGDGCAAAIIDAATDASGWQIGAFARRSWPETQAMMGWSVAEDGLDLILSRDIPAFVASDFVPFCNEFLSSQGLGLGDLAEPACHPGGGRVVDALAHYFAPNGNDLPETRDILQLFGNMSSPTILFVLEKMLSRPLPSDDRPVAVTALGPGFTAAVGLLQPQ